MKRSIRKISFIALLIALYLLLPNTTVISESGAGGDVCYNEECDWIYDGGYWCQICALATQGYNHCTVAGCRGCSVFGGWCNVE